MQERRGDLSAILRSVEPGAAEGHVREWADRIERDEILAPHFYRANVHARMGGQIFVKEIEAKQRTIAFAAIDAPFLHVPFVEAVEHFLGRRLVTPEAFAALSNDERFRAFTMSRIASGRIRQRALNLLADAVDGGEVGIREFARQIQADEVNLGFTPSHRSYLDNVFRTAMSTSYNAGRFEQQIDPDVADSGLVWEYITAGDARVRPAAGERPTSLENHRALDGKQWEIGDPEALPFYPPNGFNERCIVAVTERNDAQMAQETRIEWVHESFRAPPLDFIQSEAASSAP